MSLWVLVGPCESLWVLANPRESLWILVSPCWSLWILVNPCESLWESHMKTIWKPNENRMKTICKTIRKHMKTIWKPLLADARCCLQKQGRPRHSNEKNGASRSLSSQVPLGAQKHCKKQCFLKIFYFGQILRILGTSWTILKLCFNMYVTFFANVKKTL